MLKPVVALASLLGAKAGEVNENGLIRVPPPAARTQVACDVEDLIVSRA